MRHVRPGPVDQRRRREEQGQLAEHGDDQEHDRPPLPGPAQCQRTGEIWSAGAGNFARIEYREAPGLRIQGRPPTIEDVADNIDKIADLSTNKVFRTSSEEVAAVVGS